VSFLSTSTVLYSSNTNKLNTAMKPKTILKKSIKSALIIGVTALSMSAMAQDQAKVSFKTEKVTETILKAEIASVTDKPIDYMINTHIHGDHIGNNHVFGKEGAKIVSHENLRESLLKDEKNGGPASFPVLTFNDRMTIHLNGDAAQIIHFDNAHTDGDAVVYFKNDNVLHTGDIMFNQMFPFIDNNNGGSLDGVIRALEGIAALVNDETKIIPGHGVLASRKDVLSTIDMLKTAKESVGKLVSAGKSDEEILKANPLAPFESFSWGFITTERMTQQVLTAFKK